MSAGEKYDARLPAVEVESNLELYFSELGWDEDEEVTTEHAYTDLELTALKVLT